MPPFSKMKSMIFYPMNNFLLCIIYSLKHRHQGNKNKYPINYYETFNYKYFYRSKFLSKAFLLEVTQP